MTARIHGDAYSGDGLLDFAVNIWPRRPAFVDDVLARALQARGYPDEREARAALAARHGREGAEVLLLNGACEAFWLLAHALRPHAAACVHPSFTEPDAALRAAGARVARVPREPEHWTFDPIAVPGDAEVVVIGNPNNPTGTLTGRADVLSLLRPGRLVVVDESFMDFVEGERESVAGERRPGLAVVRSLTKAWSLAGVRAGYLLGPPDLVATLAAHRQPWAVNAMACAALAACARDRTTAPRRAREVAAIRARLLARLAELPDVRAWPSEANFLLLRVADGPAVADALRRAGVAVRPGASFPGLDDRYLRVAVRPEADLLADALAAAL